MSLGKTYVEGDNGELYTEPPLAGDGWDVGWDDGDMLVSAELRGGSPAEAWQRAEAALTAAGMQFKRDGENRYWICAGGQAVFPCTALGPVPVGLLPTGRIPVQNWDRKGSAGTCLLFTEAARQRMLKNS